MNGYALAVEVVRVIDGDTLVVAALGRKDGLYYSRTKLDECPSGQWQRARYISPGMEFNVRLADFSAPERREAGGPEATEALKDMVNTRIKLWLFVEAPKDSNGNGEIDLRELLKLTSFERIVGRIMIGDENSGCVSVANFL